MTGPNPDEARRYRQRLYLERLYRGWQIGDTAPPRYCIDYPECPEPCPGCAAYAKRFNAWTAAQ